MQHCEERTPGAAARSAGTRAQRRAGAGVRARGRTRRAGGAWRPRGLAHTTAGRPRRSGTAPRAQASSAPRARDARLQTTSSMTARDKGGRKGRCDARRAAAATLSEEPFC